MSPVQLAQQLSATASPLEPNQVQQLTQLMNQLNPIQQAWVSGYLAASAQTSLSANGSMATQSQPETQRTLTILYGSQTGNAKGVAEKIKHLAASKSLNVNLVNMADYKAKQLKQESHLIVVVSTYGEGEPPEDAESLHQFLGSKKAPKLPELNVAVVGLGDSSYEFFCQTAIDFDERFKALGAKTALERAELDVDYEQQASQWSERVIELFEPELKQKGGDSAQVIPIGQFAETATTKYTKQNPFTATISVVQKITGRDSTKDVRHIEISLEDSGIQYQPGDSLGVYFDNDVTAIKQVLDTLSLSGSETVAVGETELTLNEALISQLELTQSYPGFVEKYAQFESSGKLEELLTDKANLREYLSERQIYDIISEFPVEISAQQLVDCMRKIQPRLYSIASSQSEVEDEVHLTVGVVQYQAFDKTHFGGCSGFLAHRVEEDTPVRVFVEHNDKFRLPSSGDSNIIMVGPGTGIAPFRAFLQQREADDAEGQNWLFFGNPHFTQDFLYQTEIQSFVKDGVLNQVDLAFSRDQAEKVYVQHKLLEKGEQVFAWLEQGAYFYVCGDANHMAKDVHDALLQIIQQFGNRNQSEAEQYLSDLKQAKRYQKDVY
jgi:sulfite reductase (NADPH) flavoprotein alpha-component